MITYRRKLKNGDVVTTKNIKDVFNPQKENEKECWLFVSPHDDDLVLGAGNTILAALNNNIEVHCAITSDGSMGYCTPEHKNKIADIRKIETEEAYKILGVKNVHFLNFPDCSLTAHGGRTFNVSGKAWEVANATGLQNSFVELIRKVNPNRVFIPTQTDLHPDHKIVNSEMLISVFHAEGGIWPELGERIPAIPTIYEYAVYTDFIAPPQICVEISSELIKQKQDSMRAYASQTQIEDIIKSLSGAYEFIHEIEFNFYKPDKYLNEFIK